MRSARFAFAIASALPLAACGGGSGGDAADDRPKQIEVPALSTSGLGSVSDGGFVSLPPELLRAGENELFGTYSRAFFTFPLAGLATDDLAACRLHALPAQVAGDPEASPIHGFVAEPVDVGPSLDASDYARSADLPPSARATRREVGAGTYAYEFDVLAHVKAALAAGRTAITFRVRILGVPDMDGQPDLVLFRAADPSWTSLHPRLEVTHR
jgi:hypothetical protein